jgi:hypothetical protein
MTHKITHKIFTNQSGNPMFTGTKLCKEASIRSYTSATFENGNNPGYHKIPKSYGKSYGHV